jgi:hypothetical protein
MQVVLVERGLGSLQFKPAAQQRPQTEARIGDPIAVKGAVPHLNALPHMRGLLRRDSWVAVTRDVTRAVAGVTTATIYQQFPTLCFSGTLVSA